MFVLDTNVVSELMRPAPDPKIVSWVAERATSSLFLTAVIDAHARKISGFYSQDDLERRIAACKVRRDLSSVAIDRKIVDRDYHRLHRGAVGRDFARTPQAAGRDGNRHRQDPDSGGSRQPPVRGRYRHPCPVSRGPDRPGRTG